MDSPVGYHKSLMAGWLDSEMDRCMGGWMNGRTDGQMDGWMDG